jgi:hypothetical protein
MDNSENDYLFYDDDDVDHLNKDGVNPETYEYVPSYRYYKDYSLPEKKEEKREEKREEKEDAKYTLKDINGNKYEVTLSEDEVKSLVDKFLKNKYVDAIEYKSCKAYERITSSGDTKIVNNKTVNNDESDLSKFDDNDIILKESQRILALDSLTGSLKGAIRRLFRKVFGCCSTRRRKLE